MVVWGLVGIYCCNVCDVRKSRRLRKFDFYVYFSTSIFLRLFFYVYCSRCISTSNFLLRILCFLKLCFSISASDLLALSLDWQCPVTLFLHLQIFLEARFDGNERYLQYASSKLIDCLSRPSEQYEVNQRKGHHCPRYGSSDTLSASLSGRGTKQQPQGSI